jgi:hypothetical protein
VSFELHEMHRGNIAMLMLQAFIGRSWALLRPWGLLMSIIRALSARNKGRSGRRRALLVGTYRCAQESCLHNMHVCFQWACLNGAH